MQCFRINLSFPFSSQFLMGVDRMSIAPLAISPVGISPSACHSFSIVMVWTTVGTKPMRATVVSEVPVVTAGTRDKGLKGTSPRPLVAKRNGKEKPTLQYKIYVT